jgi:hypothetical protein
MKKLCWAVLAFSLLVTRSARSSADDHRKRLDDAIRSYEAAGHTRFRGLPEDASLRHLSFSRAVDGDSSRLVNDPTYWLDEIRRAAARQFTATPMKGSFAKVTQSAAHRDWTAFLGQGATVGALNFPAKFSLTVNGTPSCSDFIVFNTSLSGTSTRPSLVAFNNLYKAPTCAGTVPAVFWAYNTGGNVVNSVIISPDGTQVAFVQTTHVNATLIVLKWPSAGGGTIAAPLEVPVSHSYPSCTAPCMAALPFANKATDFSSAPFYDYSGSDTLFVGDQLGVLHEFHPVFSGSPQEVVTGGFPLTVSQTGRPLSDPVYESATGLVFVGEGHNGTSTNDGTLHAVDIAAASVSTSAPICRGVGFLGAPLLDPTAQTLYLACANDVGGGNCPAHSACLRQFSETGISQSTGTGVPLGAGAATTAIGGGAFDNLYLTSADPAAPSGNFYICGNPSGLPTIYRVPITSNLMGSPLAINTVSGTTGAGCSPITEFFNDTTNTDWLFVSTSTGGNQTGCTSSGCLYGFNATVPLNVGANAGDGIAVAGGSSGIIVDNIGAATSTAANVYYSSLANQACAGQMGGCAVQASQNGLQ